MGHLPGTRGYVCDIFTWYLPHTPEGQVNNMLIFHL